MTPLWTTDISILYEKKYIFEIIPNKQFDFNRKLNSLLRLSIYFAIIIYAMDQKNSRMFYIPFIVAVLTYILSQKYQETFINKINNDLMNDIKDEDDHNDLISKFSKNCNVPTKENPFMNPLLTDLNTDYYEKEACDSYNNKGIQKEIETKFTHDLIRDVNDIFGKENSQRQYYTIPKHDQGSFARWLYATPPTCKEGNGLQCAANQLGIGSGPGAATSS
jgi:hypothetical protein